MKVYLLLLIFLSAVFMGIEVNPPAEISALDPEGIRVFLSRVDDRFLTPHPMGITMRRTYADGRFTWMDIIYGYEPPSTPKGKDLLVVEMKFYIAGPGFIQYYLYDRPHRPVSERPENLFIDSFGRREDIHKFLDVIINSGLFEIPLKKVSYETGRVEHPTQKGRWYVGHSWYWDDPNGLLCETKSCKENNDGTGVYLSAEDFGKGRDYIHFFMSAGHSSIWWNYDQMHKPGPMTEKFQKVLQYVDNILIPFAEKNYYRKSREAGGKVIERDLQGPQYSECFKYDPMVCGYPTNLYPQYPVGPAG